MTLSELEKLCEAATPEPLEVLYLFGSRDLPVEMRFSENSVLDFDESSTMTVGEVRHIVDTYNASRTMLPKLLKLWAECEEIKHWPNNPKTARIKAVLADLESPDAK